MITFTKFFNERSSRAALGKKIAAAIPNLSVGGSSKDTRLQPLDGYDPEKFAQDIESVGLQIVKVVKPNEPGSTSSQLNTYIVRDEDGEEYPVTLGKGKGFGVRDEATVLNSISNQIQDILGTEGKDFFTIKIDNKKYKVNGIETTPGTPKSDFHLTFNGEPVVFISHKKGTTAKHYQQYGGTSLKSGEIIHNHPEVKSFIQKIAKLFPEGMPPGSSVYRPIDDTNLKMLAIYGPDYGKEFGYDNVTLLLQGNVKLNKTGNNLYEFEASHISFNGEAPEGDYDAVLYGRYNPSRGGNHGIKALRSSIMPLAKLSSKTQKI
tara:strand:+ start:59 stop:1018 length:960 start_codon:yes stop_codon:yes gene_type:complete